MENGNKSIRIGIVNEAEPKGTVIIPDADFIFAVVHVKGADYKKVICQGIADRVTAGECLLAALDGVKDMVADDPLLGALVMTGLTDLIAKEKGEEADDDGSEE